MTRTEAAIARIRADHAAGRITSDERTMLIRAAAQAADANRDVQGVLDEHARRRA